MNDLLDDQEVLVVVISTFRKTNIETVVEIFSKICKELIISESDAVVQVHGEDLWRFYHGDCETSAGEFYGNFLLPRSPRNINQPEVSYSKCAPGQFLLCLTKS